MNDLIILCLTIDVIEKTKEQGDEIITFYENKMREIFFDCLNVKFLVLPSHVSNLTLVYPSLGVTNEQMVSIFSKIDQIKNELK